MTYIVKNHFTEYMNFQASNIFLIGNIFIVFDLHQG